MPELPYAQDALAPRMSADTLAYHYGKHLQAYIDTVNSLVKDTPLADKTLKELILEADGKLYNQAAQAWNHILFFRQLTPNAAPMSSAMSQAIAARWGSFDEFKKEFTQAAVGLFGSGWVFLALDHKHELQIVPEPNAGNPYKRGLRPLMCIDVWEHAYYLDYQNRRAAYVDNFWSLIDWSYVEHRMTLDDSLMFY